MENFMIPNHEIVVRLELLNAYKRARIEQYGEISNQLDMIFKDIDSGLFGENAKNGSFYNHIKTIKDSIPKPDVDTIKMELDQLISNEIDTP